MQRQGQRSIGPIAQGDEGTRNIAPRHVTWGASAVNANKDRGETIATAKDPAPR